MPTLDEVVADVEAVTAADVGRVIERILAPGERTLAVVGPVDARELHRNLSAGASRAISSRCERAQPPQPPAPDRREPEAHDAAVTRVGLTAHEVPLLGAVDQLHRTVVAEQERAGDVTDGRRIGAGVAPDREQELVLGR